MSFNPLAFVGHINVCYATVEHSRIYHREGRQYTALSRWKMDLGRRICNQSRILGHATWVRCDGNKKVAGHRSGHTLEPLLGDKRGLIGVPCHCARVFHASLFRSRQSRYPGDDGRLKACD